MSDQTPNLGLPYILPSQALKHVTHNDALRIVDGLVQLAITDRTLTAPPATPGSGDRYVVAASGTGDWAGEDGRVAMWQDGAWSFATPQPGWIAWMLNESRLMVFDGAGWAPAALSGVNPVALVGVNATADAGHRLSVKSDAVLFSHDDTTPGTGSVQLTLNKGASAQDAGLVLQDEWTTRALVGLFGDDDFSLKVSPDGSSFHPALVVDGATGKSQFPSGVVHPETGLNVLQMLPLPQMAEIWQPSADRAATPRSYLIAAISGSTIDLTTAQVPEVYGDGMRNAAMVRIWNTSKTPPEAAWVNWNNSATQLNVSSAADIVGWSAGDTLQLGDPNATDGNVLGMIALDISNLMFNSLGAVFRQAGVVLAASASGTAGDARLIGSGSGATGSVLATPSDTDGKAGAGMQVLFTSQLSPISNSNLVYVGEELGTATALGACDMRVLGFYV